MWLSFGLRVLVMQARLWTCRLVYGFELRGSSGIPSPSQQSHSGSSPLRLCAGRNAQWKKELEQVVKRQKKWKNIYLFSHLCSINVVDSIQKRKVRKNLSYNLSPPSTWTILKCTAWYSEVQIAIIWYCTNICRRIFLFESFVFLCFTSQWALTEQPECTEFKNI